jgi:tripartite-type tricarboxylate transporter receptor subunit TctC
MTLNVTMRAAMGVTMDAAARRTGDSACFRGLWLAAFAAFVIAVAPASWAQYPSRAIRIIVPISPGGAPDVAARVLGQGLSETLGVPVVIENKLGSNGTSRLNT